MPTIRFVGTPEPAPAFISLERIPFVLGEVRAAFLKLEAELRKTYPILYVTIQNQN